jgi:hypothetical protein
VSRQPAMVVPEESRRLGYPRRLPRARGNGPWAIASFIAIPLFFSALMASTLAQERPRVVQWHGCRTGVCTTWHDPSSGTEARIWLWALLPALLLSLVGWICNRLPYGFYVACAAGIVEAFAVVHKLDVWTRHHTARFPNGVDLIPRSNPTSNQYNQGEWEHLARETALSLSHWTVGLSAAAIVVMAALAVRRRYHERRVPAPGGAVVTGVHAADATAAVELELTHPELPRERRPGRWRQR